MEDCGGMVGIDGFILKPSYRFWVAFICVWLVSCPDPRRGVWLDYLYCGMDYLKSYISR